MKANKPKRIKATTPAAAKAEMAGQMPTSRPAPVAIKNERAEAPSTAGHATAITAKIDVGLGNALFIRGQGNGLSWDKGVRLVCEDASTWTWSTPQAKDKVVFKLLLNDQIWALGQDMVVEAGRRIEVTPSF